MYTVTAPGGKTVHYATPDEAYYQAKRSSMHTTLTICLGGSVKAFARDGILLNPTECRDCVGAGQATIWNQTQKCFICSGHGVIPGDPRAS